eukprot:gene4758-3414_t
MGEKVEAFHRKTNGYRVGKIVAVHKSTGLYDVSFDEGGEELDISRDLIRSINADGGRNDEQASPSAYKVGDQVEANREGKDIWRYAVIAKVHPDSYYDVVYTDRARENRIPPNYVRGLYASVDQISATSNKASVDVFANPSGFDDITVDDVSLGMIVEARYHGGKQYFTGTITRISKRSNTVDILYEDGDAETFLPVEYVRLIPGKSIHSNNSGNSKEADPPRDGPVVQQEALYPVGTAIEGNFQGKNRWYPAVVTRIRHLDNGECRYAVRYKDGDFEENVPQHMLRMPKLRPLNDSGSDGAAASANAHAASSASTTTATSSSTDPAADSPLKNRRVTPSSTPSESNGRGGDNASSTDASPSRHHHRHHRGHHRSHHKKQDTKPDKNRNDDDDDDDQLGNFGGDDHDDHPGPVLSTKIAGDLHLATSAPGRAKKHRHHHRHHRHHGDEPSVSGSSTARQDSRSTTPLPAERPVEAEAPAQGSRSRTAPSRNDPPPSAGRMVPQELDADEQRPTTAPTAATSKPDKKTTDRGIPLNSVRIEANFQGKGVWFPGRLIKERGNGTVDVLYDDGDKELGVPVDRIRPINSNRPAVDPVVKPAESTAATDASRLSESQERNGADKSQGRHHHHRKDKKPSGPGEYAVGDRVMADFRNQGQYYAGTVKRLHSHGLTVDIVYDDGDVEKKVPTDRVQKMDSFSKPNTAAATAAALSRSTPAPAAAVAAPPATAKPKPAVVASAATTTNIGELDIGALVETQELDGKRPISGWQPGRILRLYPSQAAADIKLLQPSPVTGNEMLVLHPWANIRFLTQQAAPVSSHGASGNKASSQRAQPAPAATKTSEPPVVAIFPQDSSDQQLQQALALNSNDVAALREFLRRKDAEIDRLRQQVSVLQQPDEAGRRTAPVGAGRPGRQLVNAAPTAAAPAVDDSSFTPHAPRTAETGPRPSRAVNGRAASQAPIAASEGPTEAAAPADASQQPAAIEQLARANEELKRSVAFLGQKFTMVVEELVRVKNHEEKLAKHVKKQGELIKRLYHDRGTSLPAVNHHNEDF